MQIRKLHRLIGLVMLLPLLGWASTGLVFFIKPGYQGAYELLQPKTYPVDKQVVITPQPSWLEFRYLRTVLGDHLLVRIAQGWQHLDPATLALRKTPTTDEISRLLLDAFATNPVRYGQVTQINNNVATTSTNVQIVLDWNRLSIQQRGRDTERIDWLYKIHYLQWTGVKWVDRIIGILGITCITILSILGLMLAFNLRAVKRSYS